MVHDVSHVVVRRETNEGYTTVSIEVYATDSDHIDGDMKITLFGSDNKVPPLVTLEEDS